MINIKNLSFGYTKKNVLEGINISIPEGGFCALIGPNGSGKSTLLQAVAGLLPTASNTIFIQKKNLSDITAMDLAHTIAYVPQHQDIIFDLSVYEAIMLGRFPYQGRWSNASNRDREIVEHILHKTHLTYLKDRMLTQLSGGEIQRAMIARAMAQQTPILLLDEPLSNLDITHKFEIMDILKELNQKENVTIFIILHDFPFASRYAKQTLILHEGKVQNFGNTPQILTIENLRNAFQLPPEYTLDAHGNIIRND